jgi:hypothetical protein
LTSVFSTTGARNVGQPARSTMRLLLASPAKTRTAAVRNHLQITRHIAGTAYPIDDAEEAAIAARGWDRCAGNPAAGVARQIQAIQNPVIAPLSCAESQLPPWSSTVTGT